MFSLNDTDNFIYRIAHFFYDIPVLFDEAETNPSMDYDKIVMNICEGIDRGKAKAEGGVQNNQSWNNAFIITSEHSIVKQSSKEGVKNRILQIESNEKIIENGVDVANFVCNNYGWAGKDYVEYIKKISNEQLYKRFLEIFYEIKSLDITSEKQALIFSTLLLADELSCESIFKENKPFTIEDVKEYIISKDEINTSKKSFEYVCDTCASKKRNFILKDKKGEITECFGNEFWGMVDPYEITINKNVLLNILEKGGFDFQKTLKDWEKDGVISKYSNGKYYHSTSVGGHKAYYIDIKTTIYDDEQDTN